jgi:ketosteroid isomerase-like protein
MTPEQDDASVRATLKAMSEAWARQDAAQFAACYANDASVIGPGIYGFEPPW